MENCNYEIYKGIMSDNPIIDAGYIDRILRLSIGEKTEQIEVTKVEESNTAIVIKVSVQIRSTYEKRSQNFFVKTMKRNKSGNVYHDLSMKEGEFYKLVKDNLMKILPIPKCYDVFLSKEKGEFVIILEDISDRYTPPDDAMLENENIWLSCAESLASFHSVFWNSKDIQKRENVSEHDGEADRDCLRSFLNYFKNQFDNRMKTILNQAMEINISLIREMSHRENNLDNITICNGDSHISNFMLPKDGDDTPLMIDFQFWGYGIGTGDLAHLTRDRFPDELKRRIQLPLVEHYHQSLFAKGITSYPLEKCLTDYRHLQDQ